MNKVKKIILNIATHGDEKIGLSVTNAIKKLHIKNGEIIVNIANERAFTLNKRYIDQDLNRSFPGKKSGNYEEQRAHELLPLIKSADIVLDIHSTTSELRDALIVTRLNKKIKEYIKIIGPKYALHMTVTKNNALISHAKIGFAFEYGKDKDRKVIKKVVSGIQSLLSHLDMIDPLKIRKKTTRTIFFNVYKTVSKPQNAKLDKKVKNYKLIKKEQIYATTKDKKIKANQDFYPILFGNKNYKDIFGFAGRKIKSVI
jgi:succinylglutamate desuccinylase